jgi:hypothetical protein
LNVRIVSGLAHRSTYRWRYAKLDVREARPLLGWGHQALRAGTGGTRPQRHLALPRLHQRPLGDDDVPEIRRLREREARLVAVRLAHGDLEALVRRVAQVHPHELAAVTTKNHPTPDRDPRTLVDHRRQRVVTGVGVLLLRRFPGRRGLLVHRVGVGVVALRRLGEGHEPGFAPAVRAQPQTRDPVAVLPTLRLERMHRAFARRGTAL